MNTETNEHIDQQFLLGVNYWPRSKGVTWWRRHDRGEVREELAQAAAIGFNAVRLHLLWEAFQPRLDRVEAQAMQALEQTLDAAQERGLRVIATLFVGAVGGALCCPRWLTASSAEVDLARVGVRGSERRSPLLAASAETQRVVFEDGYHNTIVREFYTDPALLEAQRYLIREVVGYFGSHPALYAWELGQQSELLYMPRAADHFAEWQRRLSETARASGGQRVLASIGLRALARKQGPRPDSLAEMADGLLAVADPPPGLGRPERPLLEEGLLAFALTKALAPAAPTLVDDLGLPTAFDDRAGWVTDEAYGQEQPCFLASEEQQADALALRLRTLYEGGAAGVVLAGLCDPSRELWKFPPLRRGLRGRTVGLLHANGAEKAAVAVVAHFAAQLRGGGQRVPGAASVGLGVDTERYAGQPGAEMQRLMRLVSE